MYVAGIVFGETSSSLSGPSDSIRALTFVLAEALYWIDSGVTGSWPEERPRTSSRSHGASSGSGDRLAGTGAGVSSSFSRTQAENVDGSASTPMRIFVEPLPSTVNGSVVSSGSSDVGDVVDDRVERAAGAGVDERAERAVCLAVVVVVALVEGDVADLVDAARRLEALVARDERDELLGGVLARRQRPALGPVADGEAHAPERLRGGGRDARVDGGREVEVAAVELRRAQDLVARVQPAVDLRRDAVDAHVGVRALGLGVRHVDRRADVRALRHGDAVVTDDEVRPALAGQQRLELRRDVVHARRRARHLGLAAAVCPDPSR